MIPRRQLFLVLAAIAGSVAFVDMDVKYVVLMHSSLEEWQSMRRTEGKSADTEILAMADATTMTSMDGTKFSCFIPTEESLQMEGSSADLSSESYQLSLLSAHLNQQTCTVLRKGYWTYEVCPFKGVRQFHQEGKKVSAAFSLGKYESQSFASPQPGSSQRVYSQTFGAGDSGRKSTVLFQCPRPGSKNAKKTSGLFFLDVVEAPKLEYTIRIDAPIMCEMSAAPGELIGSTSTEWKQKCVRQVQKWWTVEVCPGHYVKQYHKETDGTFAEILIGSFDSGDVGLVEPMAGANQKVLANQLHYRESFSNGQTCEKTGAPRSASVRYFCDASEVPDAGVEASTLRVARVSEVATCQYEINVIVPALCAHATFKQNQERAQMNLDINCLPASEFP